MFMMNQHKIFLALLAVLLAASDAFAAGTPAGTVIQSRSRVTFSSRTGAAVDTAYSAVLTITVGQKSAVNITPATNAFLTSSDSTNVDYPVNIINSGNGTDAAKLTAVSSRGWGTAVYNDANGDGILQPNELSAGSISQTLSMAADAQRSVIIRIFVPRNESLNGAKDTTSLTARSLFDTTRSNTGRYITTVRTTGFDPLTPGLTVNNPTPSAGQQITYSFTLTNNGTVAATGISISDLVPAGLTFVSGSASLGTVNGSSNPVLWTIGTLSPSQSVTVTVTFTVNNGITPGTVIPNRFTVSYSSGTNNYSVQTNLVTVTVTGVLEYGVQIIPYSVSQSKEMGDSLFYRYSVKNTGAFKDVVELSAVSNLNFAWKLYRDANNNGNWDITDPQLSNSNDSSGVDSDSLAVGDSLRIFARTLIPLVSQDQMRDSLRVTAASAGDHAKTSGTVSVTTISAPVVTLQKTTLPAGDQPAGSVISYLITYNNEGSVAVNDFAIVDTTPEVTKYIPNSVKVNGIARSDNTGGVVISSDGSNNTVVTVSIGTLSAKSTGTVEFKVKIK